MMSMLNPPRDGEGDRAKRGGGGSQSLRRPLVYTARRLRAQMSLPEVLLWNQLRAAKLGVSFRKQHPIGPYIADFYCAPLRLVIEVDGDAHNRGTQPQRDVERDRYLNEQSYHILRIPADDILKDMDGVIRLIAAETDSPLRPLRGHLPASGEDHP